MRMTTLLTVPFCLAGLAACGPDGGAPADQTGTSSVEAQAAYDAGSDFLQRRIGRADPDSAVANFRRAVELDPEYAAAWAGLSQAHMWLEFNQGVRDQLPLAQ